MDSHNNMDVEEGPSPQGLPIFSRICASPPEAQGNGAVGMMHGHIDYDQPDYPDLPHMPNLKDWTYTMRRTMQEIIPGLFLGPFASATKACLAEMKAAGLTHVICIRHPFERHIVKANHPDHFNYLTLEFPDLGNEPIIGHLRAAIEFIDGCRQSGGSCLVHGNAGISRSGAIVIGYIMATYGVTAKEAFHHTQDIRFCVNPNDGFMNQLLEFEPIYRAIHLVPKPLPQMEGMKNPLKRPANESSDDEGNDGGHERK